MLRNEDNPVIHDLKIIIFWQFPELYTWYSSYVYNSD